MADSARPLQRSAKRPQASRLFHSAVQAAQQGRDARPAGRAPADQPRVYGQQGQRSETNAPQPHPVIASLQTFVSAMVPYKELNVSGEPAVKQYAAYRAHLLSKKAKKKTRSTDSHFGSLPRTAVSYLLQSENSQQQQTAYINQLPDLLSELRTHLNGALSTLQPSLPLAQRLSAESANLNLIEHWVHQYTMPTMALPAREPGGTPGLSAGGANTVLGYNRPPRASWGYSPVSQVGYLPAYPNPKSGYAASFGQAPVVNVPAFPPQLAPPLMAGPANRSTPASGSREYPTSRSSQSLPNTPPVEKPKQRRPRSSSADPVLPSTQHKGRRWPG
jgi:hypothetical protein